MNPSLLQATREAPTRYISEMSTAYPRAVLELAALAQRVVDESGDPMGFDALAWTMHWLQRPLPALGGARPAEHMGAPEGRALLETLIMRMQSGAYS